MIPDTDTDDDDTGDDDELVVDDVPHSSASSSSEQIVAAILDEVLSTTILRSSPEASSSSSRDSINTPELHETFASRTLSNFISNQQNLPNNPDGELLNPGYYNYSHNIMDTLNMYRE